MVPRPPNGPDWVHEIKLDGWRLQVRVEDGSAKLSSRKAIDYTGTFPELAKAGRGFDNCIIDGEICSVTKEGLTDFSALQAAMKAKRTERLIFFAFDLLWLGDEDMRARPLMDRKAKLRELLDQNKDQKVIHLLDHLDADGREVFEIARKMNLEGIVSKRLSAPYVSGRTGVWTKAKCRATQHALVGGWTVSDKGFSSLLLGVRQGKSLVPIGRVGSGFPVRLVDWLWPRLKRLEIPNSPFSEKLPRMPGREIHWAKPELVAGIEFTSWTQDRLLRQASLQEVRERTDKSFRPDRSDYWARRRIKLAMSCFGARRPPRANTPSLATRRATRPARFWCWRWAQRSASKSTPANAHLLVAANRYEFRNVEVGDGNIFETRHDRWTGATCVTYANAWQLVPEGLFIRFDVGGGVLAV
jgi:DNA ligase D-like protein (predicted ligase)